MLLHSSDDDIPLANPGVACRASFFNCFNQYTGVVWQPHVARQSGIDVLHDDTDPRFDNFAMGDKVDVFLNAAA